MGFSEVHDVIHNQGAITTSIRVLGNSLGSLTNRPTSLGNLHIFHHDGRFTYFSHPLKMIAQDSYASSK